jgi:hypothetical protein
MDRPDPLASNATVRLRQTRPDPNNVYGLVTLAALVILFGGFIVLWLETGSGTVGERGTFSALGSAVWVGPLAALVVLYFTGPRGALRVMWEPPVVLTLDDRGMAWTLPGPRNGSCTWDDLGGVSSGVDWRGPWRSFRDRSGGELLTVRGPFLDESAGRDAVLPTLVVARRPDLFEPLDVRHPERACVRRTTR